MADEAAVAAWVAAECGEAVVAHEFVRTGAATTYGVRLAGGRRLVVKVHAAGQIEPARLVAAKEVQRRLQASGFPCPRPIAGPARLGRGLATAEEHLDRGEPADPADPATPALMARALGDMVARCRKLTHLDALDAERLGRYPLEPLWRASHDPRVDFAVSARSAAWIDALAREARRRRYSTPVGRVVVGHNDWRVEHVRVAGGRVSAAYDWDSLVRTREPLLVASSMRGFTADWSRSRDPVVPTLEQARAFLDAYEDARALRFNAVERALIYAGWVDALAYAARWEHGLLHGAVPPGGFQERLAAAAPALLGAESDPRVVR